MPSVDCRREGPKVIRQALETDLDREFSRIGERAMSKLAHVMHSTIVQLLTTYQSIKPPEEVSSMPDPNSAVATRDAGGVHASPPSFLLEGLESYIHELVPEEIDFGCSLEGDPLFQGFSFQGDEQGVLCDQSYVSDSAYHTYTNRSEDSGSSRFLTSPVHDSRRSHHY